MALLDPDLYSNDVLVVGDGNFSFTLCLASALSQTSVKIIATSLDSVPALANSDFALQNIEKLSSFENVEVLHEVDATDLSRTFGSRIFDRVIFNFPHVGGKSNIGKSRELLKRFFASAAKHVSPEKGEICVSLCQGQGGTPLDNLKRQFGNSWQVVYQAAKADLILNAVYPFRSADYGSYQSAGFRGQLGKGFHTINGLTHVFVHGVPMKAVPDIESFITNNSSFMSYCYPTKSLSFVPGNPLYIISNKLKSFFSDIAIIGEANVVFKHSENIDNISEQVEKLNVCGSDEAEGQLNQSFRRTGVSLLSEVVQSLQEFGALFVMSGIEIDFFFPPSSENHPICHKMIAVKTFTNGATALEVKKELDSILDLFITKMCSGLDGLRIENGCKGLTQEGISTADDLLSQEITELECGKQTKFHNLKNASSADIRCECGKETLQEKCIYCKLEKHYLGQDISPPLCTSKCFQPSTQRELYHKQRLILSCGLIDAGVLSPETFADKYLCWLMEINLDNLVMTLCGIPDVRLLWSQDKRFKAQFSTLQDNGLPDLRKFVPFSFFPPTYIHDISFWITEHMTEQQFFQDIYETTQGCVCDVQFIERYYDTKQDKVSYNYRMVYSSCDRPLTHLQTVEMQNLLRRKLLNCEFHLK